MNEFTRRAWIVRWWLVAGALLGSGCQHFQIPAIDPTGERIFSSSDAMQLATPSDSRCTSTGFLFPKPAWNDAVTPPPCPEPPPPPPPGVKVPGSLSGHDPAATGATRHSRQNHGEPHSVDCAGGK